MGRYIGIFRDMYRGRYRSINRDRHRDMTRSRGRDTYRDIDTCTYTFRDHASDIYLYTCMHRHTQKKGTYICRCRDIYTHMYINRDRDRCGNIYIDMDRERVGVRLYWHMHVAQSSG